MNGLRNILREQMDRSDTRPVHESRRFSGHDGRMADHTRRIRLAPCECGSGKTYGDCCLGNDHQRSSATVSYNLPDSVHPDMAARCDIEDHLRLHAFRTFYKAHDSEHDLLLRFASAVVVSAGPIRDERQIRRWHGSFCARPSRTRREAGQ